MAQTLYPASFLLIAGWLLTTACDDTTSAGNNKNTSAGPVSIDCEVGEKPGNPGENLTLRTAADRAINVRVSTDYNPQVAAPLIVAYSYFGGSAEDTESFLSITEASHEEGYIIAYVDHGTPSSINDIVDLSEVAAIIGEQYCIDEERVILTGHSDGGSVASFLTLSPGTTPQPAALVASAAGVDDITLADIDCPEPRPIMVIHGDQDSVFPGRGARAAEWWAACNGCTERPQTLDDSCIEYSGCASGEPVVFCSGPWGHFEWPDINDTMFSFLAQLNSDQAD